MKLNNKNGSMILGVALFMAVLAGVVYFYSNVQMIKVTAQYRRTQSMAFAHQIAGSLAQNLRWAYDTARQESLNPTACTAIGGSSVTVPGSSIRLCLVGGQTCTPHPGNPNREKICVGLANNTLFSLQSEPAKIHPQRKRNFFVSLLSNIALAQGYTPLAPGAGETSNSLAAAPACLNGDCEVRCGSSGNADCITFKFCPLLGSSCDASKPEDWVFQSVGFLK